MKKVRYAAGALGALGVVPALGLITPAATAATTQASATAGKTVTLLPGTDHCNTRHAHEIKPRMKGYIAFSRDEGCIGSVIGHYYADAKRGRDMRVRYYGGNLALVSEREVTGTIHHHNHSISFRSNSVYLYHIEQVCETIVSDNNKVVIAGPACQDTGWK
jgi:hypothetical protein